jgi:hypothetical protein
MAVHVFPLGGDLCTCCGLTRDQAAIHVKRHLRFVHRHFLDPHDRTKHQVMIVTRVALGVVYYRALGGGSCYKSDLVDFLKNRIERVIP